MESEGIYGGLCSVVNPQKPLFNAFHSLVGIVLEGKVQGWNNEMKIVNVYGPYSQRR